MIKEILDRLPGWPTERQWVMIFTYSLGLAMLIMAGNDVTLWGVELFKTLITVVIVTGITNQILAFHYAANKGEEDKTANTGKAFDAIRATAEAKPSSEDGNVIRSGDEVKIVND